MLAVPLSTYRFVETNTYSWDYEHVSKLMLVEVNETNGSLSIYGEVDHSSLFQSQSERSWWDDRDIRRSIFMGDFVYAISSAGITATNLTTLEESDRVLFPQSTVYHRYAYDDAAASESESEGEERDGERDEERNEERDGEGARPTGDDSEGSSSSEPSRD